MNALSTLSLDAVEAKPRMRREAGNNKNLGLWKLIIPELRVLVLTKKHVGSGNEVGALLTKANQAQMWQARIAGYKQNPKKRERTTNVTNEHKTKTEHILLT